MITGKNKGDYIFYAGAFYEIADPEPSFPFHNMIGIYDEPPSKHIDYIQTSNVEDAVPCNSCQGGGCPTCSGFGMLTN